MANDNDEELTTTNELDNKEPLSLIMMLLVCNTNQLIQKYTCDDLARW
jgi:hypothetical protein